MSSAKSLAGVLAVVVTVWAVLAFFGLNIALVASIVLSIGVTLAFNAILRR